MFGKKQRQIRRLRRKKTGGRKRKKQKKEEKTRVWWPRASKSLFKSKTADLPWDPDCRGFHWVIKSVTWLNPHKQPGRWVQVLVTSALQWGKRWGHLHGPDPRAGKSDSGYEIKPFSFKVLVYYISFHQWASLVAQMVKHLPAMWETWVQSLSEGDPLEKAVEGSGTPLQYSCLENLMDGGAWWATVPGVAKNQTWLSDFTFISSVMFL